MKRLSQDPERILEERQVPDLSAPQRLDLVAAKLFPEFSRSRIQAWIKKGSLKVDASTEYRPRDLVQGGEILHLEADLEADPQNLQQTAEKMDLPILFEDEQLILVNKPAGMVVHPAVGNRQGTLVNGLLYQYPETEVLPRAGIVHRLDKDTTGLLLAARTLPAYTALVNALQERLIRRTYLGLVYGSCEGAGVVDAPIGRHPRDRLKMAVQRNGRPARTWFRVLTAFARHSLLELTLDTGRTHQIRVHMAHRGYPLVGDLSYGGHFRSPGKTETRLADALQGFKRQALHARRLEFVHPASGERMDFDAPLPDDFASLLDLLHQESPAEDES